MARFLCTGDLHLGAGADLGVAPGDRLREQEQVWRAIAELATEREVNAILFAGDAFEGPMPTPEHYAAFQRSLRFADCPVIAVTGNGKHDSAMRSTTAPEVITADGFEIHVEPVLRAVAGTVVALMPWASVARIVASRGGDLSRDDVNEYAAELLLRVAADLLEEAQRDYPGYPVVLMTHFSIGGATLPTGLSTDLLREPVLDLAALEAIGFDAIVAGHIHKPQELATTPDEPNMPIFYVGSPLPLNFGEADYEHGVWILDGWEQRLTNGGVVHGFAPEFVPLPSRPFVKLDVDGDRLAAGLGLGDLASIDGAFVKLRYSVDETQARRIDHAALTQGLEQAGAYRIWIDQSIEHDDVVRGESKVHEDLEPLDLLAAYLEHAGINGEVGAQIIERTRANLEVIS